MGDFKVSIKEFLSLAYKQNPRALFAELVPYFSSKACSDLNRIPRLPLLPQNIGSCKVFLNRIYMLETLPKNAVCVELGVDEGSFSAAILRYCRPKKLYLVDLWDSERYDESKYNLVLDRFKQEIASGAVEILRARSTDASNYFKNASIDWIYIDTDHSYETTRDELRMFEPKVKADGYMAGHDYTMGNWKDGYKYGVIEAVHEFCVKHNWCFDGLTLDFTENCSFLIRRL